VGPGAAVCEGRRPDHVRRRDGLGRDRAGAGIASFAILQDRVQTLVGDHVHAELMGRQTCSGLDRTARSQRPDRRHPARGDPQSARHPRPPRRQLGSCKCESGRRQLPEAGFQRDRLSRRRRQSHRERRCFRASARHDSDTRNPDKAELLWDGGFLLHHRIPMRDSAGEAGTVLTEQPLPVLTRLAQNVPGMGVTGTWACVS